MSEIRAALLVNALLAKGFREVEGRDHRYFFFHVQGRKTAVFTRISHGQRSLDDWMSGQAARQIHLSKRELLSYLECTLSGEAYLQLMIERAFIRL
ncbi:MAG TPA: hypothetical protein VNY05_34200 [Candidatus Acidoferrales bacterium]|nr:hypothetical protein [Candidatus Acidoferrales bacterium]